MRLLLFFLGFLVLANAQYRMSLPDLGCMLTGVCLFRRPYYSYYRPYYYNYNYQRPMYVNRFGYNCDREFNVAKARVVAGIRFIDYNGDVPRYEYYCPVTPGPGQCITVDFIDYKNGVGRYKCFCTGYGTSFQYNGCSMMGANG